MKFKFMRFKANGTDGRVLTWQEIAPNILTSGNLLSGVASLILSYNGQFEIAGWMILAAVFFDLMDGIVARKLNTGSQFGVEFDSIADVVSFGAAPALLMYAVYLNDLWGFGAIPACLFALCGGLRLARFNVVHSPGPFQGLPIPAGGLFISSFVIAGIQLYGLIAAAITLFAAILMVSSVPYGNLKTINKGFLNKIKLAVLFALLAMFFIFGGRFGGIIMMSVYVISGLVRFDWGKWLSAHDKAQTDNQ